MCVDSFFSCCLTTLSVCQLVCFLSSSPPSDPDATRQQIHSPPKKTKQEKGAYTAPYAVRLLYSLLVRPLGNQPGAQQEGGCWALPVCYKRAISVGAHGPAVYYYSLEIGNIYRKGVYIH